MVTLAGFDEIALTSWQQNISQTPGYISSCLLSPDTELSSPLPLETKTNRLMIPMLLIHCTDAERCDQLAATAAKMFSGEIQRYALSWQLTKQELTHG